jgi:hypothetical protein
MNQAHINVDRSCVIHACGLAAVILPDLFPGPGQPLRANENFPEMIEPLAWVSFGKRVQVFHFLSYVDQGCL